ncbi:MAG: peptidase modulator of gyrase [Gemmatimonadetes bacterium]|nr:peptidase modulator of gyrase [Gemmatimonadota bacterium]
MPHEPGAPRSLFPAPVTLLSREDCDAIAKKVLSFATADETRVTISSTTQGNMRFAVNQASTSGDNYDNVISVRSVFGTRSASSTTNSRDDASLRAAVSRAEALAKLAPEDPEAMPELGPQQYGADSPGWSEATASMEAAGRAAAVNAVTSVAKAAGLVSTGFMVTTAGAFAVANSKGLFAYRRQTGAALTTTVRTADGKGSGWAGASTNDVSKIDPAALARRAADKAKRSVNAVAIEPGRYTVVLEPTAVGNLVQLIAGAFDARSADEGRSFFSKPGGGTKIGMKVLDERVTILSDPLDPDAPGAPFGGDGFPVTRRTWIENGVLRSLNYDRYWAKKMGVPPNAGGGGGRGGGGGGGAGGSLRMLGGDATLEEMIASTERGILCTRFWYIRPVDQRTILYTGLTRDGTFLIEKGKITHPVKNLRWNESPIFMLNNLEMLGRAERVSASEDGSPGGGIIMPAVKARDFNFTSASDAV